MGKKRCFQKSEVDEPSSSKEAPSSEKNKPLGVGSRPGSSSGVRRPIDERPSKKQNKSSKGHVRRSERLEMQTPRTRSGKKKSHTHSSVTRLEGVKKIQSPTSRLSGKGSTSKGGSKKVKSHSAPDVNDERKFKSLKEFYAETDDNGASKQGKVKPSLGVGTKRKTRLGGPADSEMIQPSKKQLKVSGYSKKILQRSRDVSGDNGSKNDEEVQRENDNGAEMKEGCLNDNGDTGVSDLDMKNCVHSKKPKPCKSKDVNHLQVSDVGNIPTSGTETRKDGAEDMETDCSMMEKNQKIQNQEEHIASIEKSNEDDSLRCNLNGTMPGMAAVVNECTNSCMEDMETDCSMMEKNQKIQNQEEHTASIEKSNNDDSLRCNLNGTRQGTPAIVNECTNSCVEDMETDCFMMEKNQKIQNQEEHIASIEQSNDDDSLRCNLNETMPGTPAVNECTNSCVEDILPSVSSACKISFLIEQCDKCLRKRRLDYNSPKEELCCCLSNLLDDADITLVAKDSGECGTCMAVHFSDKHDQDMKFSDSLLHVEQSTCIMCKHPGNLLLCGGKGCRRGYHPSCLSTPEVDKLLIWCCSKCTEKKMNLGVHSVTEGIESVWDVREMRLLNCKGSQKQYLVKYKGLSHIHNHWLSETQLLHEVPELLTKFSERQEVQWKVEWTVPHRLLLKRSIAVADCVAKHKNDCAGIVSDGRCEWLVKWVGLDYDQATWELEDSSCFTTPVVQRLIQDYETRHDKAKKLPLSGDIEIQERKKGSHGKSRKHSGGVLSGANSCYLNSINKLREFHHKGHNAVLVDEQDRISKVNHLVSSLITNVRGPFLIISPCASLSVWEMEFLRIDSSINVVAYYGSTDARKITRGLEFYEDGGSMMLQVLLSTAEVLSEDLEELKAIKWEAVILDDCHQSSILAHSNTFKKLAAGWKLLLLNSDPKGNVSEYISILSLLEPSDNACQNLGLIDEASENLKMLKSKVSSHIVCPRFLEYWVPVQISNLQLEHYCSLILSNSTTLRSCTKSKIDPVGSLCEILFSMRKCCNHPYVVDPSLQSSLAVGLPLDALLDLGIRGSGKLLFLDEILSTLRNLGLKVLILYKSICGSGRDTTGDILDDFLRQRFGLDSYEHVDLTSLKKQAALDKFNRGKERSFFLLETRACSPSIKLSAVDAVIIFNSDWNPLNDLRSLQRITIDSKLEEIKVFRLYCSCTIEEKVLQLTKDDLVLDSTLHGISRSTSHMLLMWGSSYLFTKLDQFHCQNVLDSMKHMVPEDSFLKDVCNEILHLFQNHDTPNFTKFISVARQMGGSYGKNTSLIGEQKTLLEDGICPSAFWTSLLENKQPKWKFVLGCQRNRKRSHHPSDSSMPLEVQDVGIAKKSRKMDNTQKIPSAKVAKTLGKSNAAQKDYNENSQSSLANNANSVDNMDLTLEKRSEPTLQSILNNIRRSRDLKMKFDDRIPLPSEQTELFQMLKPKTLKLCEILLLKDCGKMLAEQFLEYIVKNHRVIREPETILQALQISVCWSVAALIDQNMDHKKSLAIAREKMNFSCSEDEADSMYSRLKSFQKMFLLHSEVFRDSKASNNPSDISDVVRNLQKDATTHEENSLYVNCLDKQAAKSIQTTNNQISVLGCDKLMKRLKDKQLEEVKEINKMWEEKKAELKNNCRKGLTIPSLQNNSLIGVDKLRILDDTYMKKSNDLESQILAHRKDLEARHQSERDKLQELLNKPTSENEQLPFVKHLEHQNSKNETTGVLLHLDGAIVDPSEVIVVPGVVESGNLVLKDLPEQSLGSAEKSSSFAIKAVQVDGNNISLSCRSAELLASPGICSTDHPQIDIASVRPLSDNQDQNSKSGTTGLLSHLDDAVVDSSEAIAVPEVVESGSLVSKDLLEQSLDSAEKSSLFALKADQVVGNNTLLSCRSAELFASPGICSTDHPQIDIASVCPLSDDQGLEIEHYERPVGLEEQAPHISEPSPSNLMCDVTLSHDYQQERDVSGGNLNNEPCEFYASDVTTIQQEVNSDVIPIEAGSQHVPAFAVDHATEASPSTNGNILSSQVSPPNVSQFPTFTISQLPSLSSNPLQNELERTRGEIYQIMRFHEETKSRLMSECDKEIEEVAAQIRMKYEGKLKEVDTSFSFKRNELQMYHNKVMMHKYLADALSSEWFGTKTASEMQPVFSSRLMNPLSGSLPQNTVVRPSTTVSIPTARLQHINPVAQTAPHHPVRRYAPSHRFGSAASFPVPSSTSCMPSVSCSSSGQWVQRPPIRAQCVPSVSRSSSGQWAQQPPIRAQCAPSGPLQLHSFQISNGRSHFNPNSYSSAMDLLMEIRRQNIANHANNVAPLSNTVQTLESLAVSASRATAEMQRPTNNGNSANNSASLPNDMKILDSGMRRH